jgi:hypothetical protein
LRRELKGNLDRVGGSKRTLGQERRQDPSCEGPVENQRSEQVDPEALARGQGTRPSMFFTGDQRPPLWVPEIELPKFPPEQPGAGASVVRLSLAANAP